MTTFKDVFKEKTTPNLTMKKKRNPAPYVLAVASLVLCLIATLPSSNPNIPTNPSSESEIHVNAIERIPEAKFDVETKDESLSEYYDSFPFLTAFENLPVENFYSLYSRVNNEAKCYDILEGYVLNLENVRISFSQTNEPLRDYYISKELPQPSMINGVYVEIYEWEDLLMATFEINDIYFDIETSNYEVEDLVSIIQNIIIKY